ncbi:MAG: dicarboxylate/amino acid:cation symporter [Cellulosilyticum sp.]|nr:dicarboxylate/amino acid:cation symporter [Cellulosilyticum sp.]
MKKLTLPGKILIALISGITFGLLLSCIDSTLIKQTILIDGILKLLGTGFLNAIKLLVAPLVFVSIVYATSSLKEIKQIGRIGLKTLIFYITTTALAIILSLIMANIINPGKGVHIDIVTTTTDAVTTSTSTNLIDTLLNMIPTNIFVAFSEGNVLGIIFFAILLGISMTLIGEKAKPLVDLFEICNDVLLQVISLIMNFAPFGIFALLASNFATFGFTALIPLLKYVLGTIFTLCLHLGLVYMSMLIFIGKLSPMIFLKKFMPIFSICFSTASSSAGLPLSLKTSEKQFGVSPSVCSFTLPLGATINMDGTAIMQGFAVVFVAQMYGITLGINDYIMVIITAVLASIGTASVPGVGTVMLTMVLASVNLPVDAIALLIGVDHIIDMCRTPLNVAGDHICTLLIAKSENALDEFIYNDLKTSKQTD